MYAFSFLVCLHSSFFALRWRASKVKAWSMEPCEGQSTLKQCTAEHRRSEAERSDKLRHRRTRPSIIISSPWATTAIDSWLGTLSSQTANLFFFLFLLLPLPLHLYPSIYLSLCVHCTEYISRTYISDHRARVLFFTYSLPSALASRWRYVRTLSHAWVEYMGVSGHSG